MYQIWIFRHNVTNNFSLYRPCGSIESNATMARGNKHFFYFNFK